jgi:hypothetical protein
MGRRRASRPGSWLAVVGLGLMVAGPSGAGAQTGVDGAGPLTCGTLSYKIEQQDAPYVVAANNDFTLGTVELVVPCGGPVLVGVTLELETSSLAGAEMRVRLRTYCLDVGADLPGEDPGCVAGTFLPLVPPTFTIPLPSLVGPEARSMVAAATLPRGVYFVVATVEAVSGDLLVGKAFLHAMAGGTFPRSGARVRSAEWFDAPGLGPPAAGRMP